MLNLDGFYVRNELHVILSFKSEIHVILRKYKKYDFIGQIFGNRFLLNSKQKNLQDSISTWKLCKTIITITLMQIMKVK